MRSLTLWVSKYVMGGFVYASKSTFLRNILLRKISFPIEFSVLHSTQQERRTCDRKVAKSNLAGAEGEFSDSYLVSIPLPRAVAHERTRSFC